MLNKRSSLLFIAITIVFLIKLMPAILTQEPFSIDAWPLISQVVKLLNNPSTPIFSDLVFDKYNNHWPGSILLSAMTSLVLGIEPIKLMSFLSPIINGLGLLILAVLIKKFVKDSLIPYFAVLLTGLTPSLVVFTSGVTKETFTHPLLFTAIYVSFVSNSLLLLTLTLISLSIYHHLTSLIYLLIASSVIAHGKLVHFILGRPSGIKVTPYPVIIMVTCLATYYLTLWSPILKLDVGVGDVVKLAMYVFLLNLIMFLIAFKRDVRVSPLGISVSLLVSLGVSLLMYKGINESLASSIPPLGNSAVLYFTPLMAAPLICYISLKYLARELPTSMLPLLTGWLGGVAGFLIYALLGGHPLGPSIVHRVLNFLLIPTSVLYCFIALAKHRLTKLVVVFTLLVSLVSSSLCLLNIVNGSDTVSWYWRNSVNEFLGYEFLGRYAHGCVVGDLKVKYFMEYFDVSVNTYMVKDFIINGKTVCNCSYVITNENLNKGFLIGLSTVIKLLSNEGIHGKSLIYMSPVLKVIYG